MALKTTGLKKRKKKGPPSLAMKPPKHWTGKPVGPARPKKPPVKRPGKPIKGPKIPGLKPGPGIPPMKPGPPTKPGPGPKPKPRPRPKPIPPKRPNPKIKPEKGGGFGSYVAKYPDLAKAFAKHKEAGGKGTAAAWGKQHYEKHGKKEKRKLSFTPSPSPKAESKPKAKPKPRPKPKPLGRDHY